MAGETPMTTATILDWALNPEDAKTWAIFTDRYGGRITSWCRRKGLDEWDAEDVTQGILMQIRDKIKTYKREKARFRAWLKGVTHNACVDVFRR
jgi:DNA-directed RNA polymerase specialized sigma24 family protein